MNAIRSVTIVGGGLTGLSAAAAIRSALPQVAVTLIEIDPDPAALADRLGGTLPTIHRFHAEIGIAERDLVCSGAAVPRLATRFETGAGDAEPWIHVHGRHGQPAGSIEFHQFWAAARRQGTGLPFHLYAPAGILAAHDKFVHPDSAPRSPFATFDYALRLDPPRYAAALRARCDVLGVVRSPGRIVRIERGAGERIDAIVLAGDRRIAADLFVDCSGPSAVLRSMFSDAWDDWSQWVRYDRLISGDSAVQTLSPVDVVTGRATGWERQATLADRTLVTVAYSSTDAAPALSIAGAEDFPLKPGRRLEPWRGNVLAIGDAAIASDPLLNANLALAQNAIRRALELWPDRAFNQVELDEYNRRTEQEALQYRDLAALYRLHGASEESRLAPTTAPASLAHLLEQFQRRGRLPDQEGDGPSREDWLAVLLGLGVLPEHRTPLAETVPAEEIPGALDRFHRSIAGLADALPIFSDYVDACRAAG